MKLLIDAADGSGFKAGLAYQPMIMTLGFPAKHEDRARDLLGLMDIKPMIEGRMVRNGWRMRFDVRMEYKRMQEAVDKLESCGLYDIKRVRGFRRLMR